MVKKQVSFDETANVSYDNSLSLCERKQFWYNMCEFRTIRQENRSLVALMKENRSAPTLSRKISKKSSRQQQGEQPCFRGLERASAAHVRERANKVRSFIRIVLDEYNTLRDMGLGYKTRSLTKISSSCSKRDVKYALKMAKMDSMEAIRSSFPSSSSKTTSLPCRRRYGFPPSTVFFVNNNMSMRCNKVAPFDDSSSNKQKSMPSAAPMTLESLLVQGLVSSPFA